MNVGQNMIVELARAAHLELSSFIPFVDGVAAMLLLDRRAIAQWVAPARRIA